MWRHPLISLGVLIFIVGFIIDMILEVTMIHTGMYMYSQVIPFGSIFVGTPHQFPLLWESSLVTLVMIPAGVLVYRDDTGRTVSEKLATASSHLPDSTGARVVHDDADHRQRVLPGVRACFRLLQVDKDRDLGRVPLAVSGGESL